MENPSAGSATAAARQLRPGDEDELSRNEKASCALSPCAPDGVPTGRPQPTRNIGSEADESRLLTKLEDMQTTIMGALGKELFTLRSDLVQKMQENSDMILGEVRNKMQENSDMILGVVRNKPEFCIDLSPILEALDDLDRNLSRNKPADVNPIMMPKNEALAPLREVDEKIVSLKAKMDQMDKTNVSVEAKMGQILEAIDSQKAAKMDQMDKTNVSVEAKMGQILEADANVAKGKPASTSMSNTFGRDIQLINNGNNVSNEWSTESSSGTFGIDLQGSFFISRVNVYWSGDWGRGTNSFAVKLVNAGVETVAYETTTARPVNNRTDELDLVSLGTAGIATHVILECRQRQATGYALYELEVMGTQTLHFLG